MAEFKLTAKNDLTNQRFGRLVALTVAFKSKRHYLVWDCRCDCGNHHLAAHDNLKSPTGSRSCGCLQKDTVRELRTTHGDSQKGTSYRVWQKMKERCNNPRTTGYKDYGGRGVTVCPEWNTPDGYAAFIAHIGPRPSLAYTLDRHPDPAGNYEPGNVRWATRADQNRNKRNSRKVTFGGETKTITEWARDFGMKPGMLWYRMVTKKMPFAEAVARKNEKPRATVEYRGKTLTVNQLAMLTGVDRDLLYRRIFLKKWDVERAAAPPRKKAPTITLEYKGRTHTLAEWSSLVGITALTLWSRTTKKGWPAEKALTTPANLDTFRHPDSL